MDKFSATLCKCGVFLDVLKMLVTESSTKLTFKNSLLSVLNEQKGKMGMQIK
jgi:hypothetical protein